MAKEKLDSDRINYLIWRYLVESDYQETAVKLQKEWNHEDPEQLPFAPHVTNHALVDVLNRGLLYNQVEREEKPKPPQTLVVAPVSGFFGPLLQHESPPAVDAEFENARKRQNTVEPAIQAAPIANGPSSKKPRLSNGTAHENGFEGTTPMDLDDEPNGTAAAHADENAYPSPEQAPSPTIVTDGPTQGTQVDKVNELASETTFLDLADDPSRNANTILLQCEFNPQDPTFLAAAGTDALARMWTLSRGSTDAGSGLEKPDKPRFAPHVNLLDESMPLSTTTTGLSWSSDGSTIAVSSEPNDDGIAKVEFWSKDGMQLASYNIFESPVICLRWNPDNSSCLALSPGKDGACTVVTLMFPAGAAHRQHLLPGHSLADQVLDVAWTQDGFFVLCGGDMLRAYQFSEDSMTMVKKFETREGHALSKVVYDERTRLLATASDSGIIDIWDANGFCQSFNAHQGVITALSWQPLRDSPMGLTDETERLIASAGEDGAISIWNARSPESKSKYSMTMGTSVVAISFTPDGAFLAGATNDQILIWKSDDVNVPRASWVRNDDAGWRTPQSHDSSNDEDQFSLCWDANGRKLAYGVNSRLAVIDFRP